MSSPHKAQSTDLQAQPWLQGPLHCHARPACLCSLHTCTCDALTVRLTPPTGAHLCLPWNTIQPGHKFPSAFPTQAAHV